MSSINNSSAAKVLALICVPYLILTSGLVNISSLVIV